MKHPIKRWFLPLLIVLPVFVSPVSDAWARSPLGRPSYGLNDGSNTVPSAQFERQIGDYFVTFVAFAVSPRPGAPWRLKLYAVNSDTGKPFQGRVTFSARTDGLFSSKEKRLGRQKTNDFIFRQGVTFGKEGTYIVKAFFEDNGETYQIEMPLRVGNPLPTFLIALSIGIIVLILGGVVGLRIGKRRHSRIRKSHLTHTVEHVVRD